MEKIKKDYLVEKYKNKLNDEDLKKFEEGLEQSSEHALSDIIDKDFEFVSVTKTVLFSVFLGGWGAGRFYIGDKVLGYIKLGVAIATNIISFILLGVANSLLGKELYSAALTVSIINIIYSSIQSAGMLAWWIADLVLCIRRAKKMNRDMLLKAAFAQPGPDTEKTINYHTDTYKTMTFYDKFKKKMYKRDNGKFRTAVYYSTDAGFAPVENIKLKSRTVALLLGILLGNWCIGSFYLGDSKRAVSRLKVNLSLLFSGLFIDFITFLINYICGLHLISPYSAIPLTFTIILSIANLILSIILLRRYWQEIMYCFEQVKVLNGQKIIDTLSKYSVNNTVFKYARDFKTTNECN